MFYRLIRLSIISYGVKFYVDFTGCVFSSSLRSNLRVD